MLGTDNAVQADKQALSKRVEIMTEERIRNRIAKVLLSAIRANLSAVSSLVDITAIRPLAYN